MPNEVPVVPVVTPLSTLLNNIRVIGAKIAWKVSEATELTDEAAANKRWLDILETEIATGKTEDGTDTENDLEDLYFAKDTAAFERSAAIKRRAEIIAEIGTEQNEILELLNDYVAAGVSALTRAKGYHIGGK